MSTSSRRLVNNQFRDEMVSFQSTDFHRNAGADLVDDAGADRVIPEFSSLRPGANTGRQPQSGENTACSRLRILLTCAALTSCSTRSCRNGDLTTYAGIIRDADPIALINSGQSVTCTVGTDVVACRRHSDLQAKPMRPSVSSPFQMRATTSLVFNQSDVCTSPALRSR